MVASETRSGSMKLLGGRLSLDYANTADWHASEEPVERSFGMEILDHAEASIDLEFARSGRMPLLLDHDPRQQIGVVEDVEFVPIAGIQDDLVQSRMVRHRIAVKPVAAGSRPGATRATATADVAVVHVEPAGVVGRVAIVRQVGVGILDEVIPRVPLPDDLTTLGPSGHYLVHGKAPELLARKQLGVPPQGKALLARFGVGRLAGQEG